MAKKISYGNPVYRKLTANLSNAEHRELTSIEKQTSRMFRDFWIRVMKRQGWSNVEIAKETNLTESTVRSILKKGD